MNRRTLLAGAGAGLTAAAVAGSAYWATRKDTMTPDTPTPQPARNGDVTALHTAYRFTTVDNPTRTLMHHADGTLAATLTDGARTAVFTGPTRTFTEPSTTTARIVTDSWVRLAPQPWHAGDHTRPDIAAWLTTQTTNRDDDILAIALQYLHDAPDIRDQAGIAVAGDAGFGYARADRDGADFYDYLGVPWTFPGGQHRTPSTRWNRDLDCSGYLRLIYGYRSGMTTYPGNGLVDGLPRSAWAIADHAPSVVVASHRRPDHTPDTLQTLLPGDLVFFALHEADTISHCGIYLGRDTNGGMRFVSSRGTAEGPTFGDIRGDGVIDSGYFGDRLRRAIRL